MTQIFLLVPLREEKKDDYVEMNRKEYLLVDYFLGNG
jgi:hypothetical protein